MEEGIQYSLSKLTKVKDHYDILYKFVLLVLTNIANLKS